MTIASDRKARWMNMGPALPSGISTYDAMTIAGLANWNVRLEPTISHGRTYLEQYDVVIDSPDDGELETIGRVGKRYNVFSNEEAFSFADQIMEQHPGARWEALGDLKHRSRVFGAMRLDDLQLGHDDWIGKYLIIHTSHDGSSNLSVSIAPLRWRCTNSLGFALRNAKQTFKIRHSASMAGRVQEARETLAISGAYFDAFSHEMNRLIDAQITMDEARAIVERVYPEPDADKKAAVTRWDNKMDEIFGIYNGETVENIHGTRFGILNAMTERLDWFRSSRTGEVENLDAAFAGFDNFVVNEKNRILDAVMV